MNNEQLSATRQALVYCIQTFCEGIKDETDAISDWSHGRACEFIGLAEQAFAETKRRYISGDDLEALVYDAATVYGLSPEQVIEWLSYDGKPN